MKNILFSGLGYNKNNFELMRTVLEEKGITDVLDFGMYQQYKNLSDDKLVNELCAQFDKLSVDEDVNIICHSRGCNIGLILAKEKSSKIKHAVFMSPELQNAGIIDKISSLYYRFDKFTLSLHITVYDDSIEESSESGLSDESDLYKLFIQTRSLAEEASKDLYGINSLVVYGRGDKFISRNGVKALTKNLGGKLIVADTVHHNILLTDTGCKEISDEIVKFLNDEPTSYDKLENYLDEIHPTRRILRKTKERTRNS